MLRERERKNKQTYKKQNKKTTSRSRRRNNIILPPSVLVFRCITTLTSFAFHRGKSVNNNLKRRESKFGRDFKRFGHLLRGKFSGGITRFFFFFGETDPTIHLIIHRIRFRKKGLASQEIVNCGAVSMRVETRNYIWQTRWQESNYLHLEKQRSWRFERLPLLVRVNCLRQIYFSETILS